MFGIPCFNEDMGIVRKKGGSNKRSMRPLANERKLKSFEARYGMTRAQWREAKKTLSGYDANQIRRRAYQQFLGNLRIVTAETYLSSSRNRSM
jgi:hypothetical protein